VRSTVNIDGHVAKVTDFLQATICQVESAEASDLSAGDVFFGFAGPAQDARLLVRWNVNYINFFQGVAVQEKEDLAAFGHPPLK
jgi:hypothetical protein